MKKVFLWFLMLNKRLYKKPTFFCSLLIIPLLVVLFQLAVQDEAGILTVALALENPEDEFAVEFIQQLSADASVVSFVEVSSESAVTLVETGKADAAWIFPNDLQSCIEAYAAGDNGSNGFIRVVEREQTVPLRLSREKLSGRIYERCAESMYLQYLRKYAPQTEMVEDGILLSYLDKTHVSGEVFDYYDIYGNLRVASPNYLSAPLRGMLAVLAVVCAVVTAMYYQKDEERGIFYFLFGRYRCGLELGYQMISAGNIMVAILVALVLSGLAVNFWLELFMLAFYSLCCCLFAMVLRMVMGGGRGLAVVLPVLTAVMLVVCPVFFDFAPFRFVQYLLPPTYYIVGACNWNTALYLVLYDAVLLVIYIIGIWIKAKFPNRFVILSYNDVKSHESGNKNEIFVDLNVRRW